MLARHMPGVVPVDTWSISRPGLPVGAVCFDPRRKEVRCPRARAGSMMRCNLWTAPTASHSPKKMKLRLSMAEQSLRSWGFLLLPSSSSFFHLFQSDAVFTELEASAKVPPWHQGLSCKSQLLSMAVTVAVAKSIPVFGSWSCFTWPRLHLINTPADRLNHLLGAQVNQ